MLAQITSDRPDCMHALCECAATTIPQAEHHLHTAEHGAEMIVRSLLLHHESDSVAQSLHAALLLESPTSDAAWAGNLPPVHIWRLDTLGWFCRDRQVCFLAAKEMEKLVATNCWDDDER